MEKDAEQSKRKVILINPRFQLACVAYVIGIASVIIAVLYVANAVFFWKFIEAGRVAGLTESSVFFRFIREQQRYMNWIFAGTSTVSVITLTMGGLLFSHRVAGPLHRLRQHMARVAGGETTSDLAFREDDFFPEIAESYNRQMAWHRAHIERDAGGPGGKGERDAA